MSEMTNPVNTLQKEDVPYPVWEFNYKPERYVHHSWLSNLPNAELLQRLISEDNSQKTTRLSHHLMDQLGFDGKFYFDFTDPITKLALWSGDDLQKLLYHVGILFYFDDIRKKITRADVKNYRNELGKELYDFALMRAPLLKGKQLKHINLPDSLPITQRVLLAGLVSLLTAMQDYPTPLLKRFVAKLPRKWFEAFLHYSKDNVVPGGRAGNIAVVELIMNELSNSQVDKP